MRKEGLPRGQSDVPSGSRSRGRPRITSRSSPCPGPDPRTRRLFVVLHRRVLQPVPGRPLLRLLQYACRPGGRSPSRLAPEAEKEGQQRGLFREGDRGHPPEEAHRRKPENSSPDGVYWTPVVPTALPPGDARSTEARRQRPHQSRFIERLRARVLRLCGARRGGSPRSSRILAERGRRVAGLHARPRGTFQGNPV